MKKLIISLLPDALMIVGTSAISYGAWLVYPPAGFVVCGTFCILGGVISARAVGK